MSTACSKSERKERLQALLGTKPRPTVLVVRHFEGSERQLFEQAVQQLMFEGLVAKRTDSPYRPGVRSPDWVNVKRKGAIPPERFKHGSR